MPEAPGGVSVQRCASAGLGVAGMEVLRGGLSLWCNVLHRHSTKKVVQPVLFFMLRRAGAAPFSVACSLDFGESSHGKLLASC